MEKVVILALLLCKTAFTIKSNIKLKQLQNTKLFRHCINLRHSLRLQDLILHIFLTFDESSKLAVNFYSHCIVSAYFNHIMCAWKALWWPFHSISLCSCSEKSETYKDWEIISGYRGHSSDCLQGQSFKHSIYHTTFHSAQTQNSLLVTDGLQQEMLPDHLKNTQRNRKITWVTDTSFTLLNWWSKALLGKYMQDNSIKSQKFELSCLPEWKYSNLIKGLVQDKIHGLCSVNVE